MFAKGKQKLRRQDFIFENAWFQSVTKQPGSLQMQQFQISDCQQCQILVLDSNAGIYIDDCKFCTLYLGPSQSSIFVRNCHYMDIVCITQQFRVRDCTNCRFWLWCESQPVIESSYGLTFSNFPNQLGYAGLDKQMKEAKLKLWNNNWFIIYDFTPNKYSTINHHCLAHMEGQEQIFQKMKTKIRESGINIDSKIVPKCQGIFGTQQYEVVVVDPVPDLGMGITCLHSRLAIVPEQLRSIVGDHVGKVSLFVKIKEGSREAFNGMKVLCRIKDHPLKEMLESTVFVAFADER